MIPDVFTSPTAAAFMADIIANPTDDTVRLIYADWLEEQGEAERAEFIRCQCLVHRWSVTPSNRPGGTASDGALAGEALARSQVFLKTQGYQFACPGISFENWSRTPSFAWSRGFVERLTCTCHDWLTHGPHLVKAQPLERVTLSDKKPAEYISSRGPRYRWEHKGFGGGMLPERIQLPDELRLCFTEQNLYETEAEAISALSAACLAWAKAYLAPEYGPSSLRGAYSVWRASQSALSQAGDHLY